MKKFKKIAEEFFGENGIEVTISDDLKTEKVFFAITEEDLKKLFMIKSTDSLDVARSKIKKVITTDDFLYKKFNKDPKFWELREFTPGYYTVPVKSERILKKEDLIEMGYSDEEISKKFRLPAKEVKINKTIQQKLTIKFVKRKNINCYDPEYIESMKQAAFDSFMNMLKKEGLSTTLLKSKNVSNPQNIEYYNSDFMLVIPDIELHQGKLSSYFDSQDAYDYKKALSRYIILINELEKVQDMYHANQIVMTIGNDSNNSDTEQNTTTAGTEQHNDTRFQQMIINSIVAHIWGVERLKQTCNKIILKFEPGNHDFVIDFMIYQYLEEYFKDDESVEIENTVKSLRFTTAVNFGRNLIMFYHGKHPDGKAMSDDALATLKDSNFKEESKKADYYTVIASHLHNSSENKFSKKLTAKNGVTVLRTGSPSGDGVWEGGNFYSSDKSHNAYIFDANRGLYSSINIKLTEDELKSSIKMAKIEESTNVKQEVRKAIEKADCKKLDQDVAHQTKIINEEINAISREYDIRLAQIINLLGLDVNPLKLDEETKQRILGIMGYQERINPLTKQQAAIEEYNERRKSRRKK